jgi:hypothetical protein
MLPVFARLVLSCALQGKADEWKRSWGLKPSMAIELYLQLAALMKVRQL